MKNGAETYFFQRSVVVANRLDKDLNLKLLAASSEESPIPARNKVNALTPPQAAGNARPEFKTFATTDTAFYNQTDSLLLIQTDKSTYAPGEKVSLHLDGALSHANLAVSVYEEPQRDFPDRSMAEAFLYAPATPTYHSTPYMPERQYKILRGRVLDIATNQCIPDAIVLLSCPDTVANLQYAITDADGLFQLQLSPYYDGKELFLSIKEMPAEQNWKIEVEDNFDLTSTWKPELDVNSVYAKKYLLKSQDIAYINKTYAPRAKEPEKTTYATPFCPLLYRRVVKPVFPSDFVPLDSFPEIAVELLPTLKLYKVEGIADDGTPLCAITSIQVTNPSIATDQ